MPVRIFSCNLSSNQIIVEASSDFQVYANECYQNKGYMLLLHFISQNYERQQYLSLFFLERISMRPVLETSLAPTKISRLIRYDPPIFS
jgi:hypothetical protein